MRMSPVVSKSVACPPGRLSGRLAGLGVVCLISLLGILGTAFVCFLGFRSEITAALSDDMTGSITVQGQMTTVKEKDPAVQRADSHH